LEVDSDIALPALSGRPDLTVNATIRLETGHPAMTIGDAFQGENWSMSRDEWRLWDGKGLNLAQSGSELRVWSHENPEAPERIQWIVGAGFCAVLLRRGTIPWHAAALALDDKAILIMGDSGTGKSTTAMALIAAGARLLADDLVAPGVEKDLIVIPPTFLRLRLTPQSADYFCVAGVEGADDKVSISVPHALDDRPLPLRAIFVLGDRIAGPGTSERLPKAQAWAELLKNLFARPVVPAFAGSERAATKARRMIDSVPVFQLRPRDGLDRLSDVAETIRAAIGL
jgi:hypothetical protein